MSHISKLGKTIKNFKIFVQKSQKIIEFQSLFKNLFFDFFSGETVYSAGFSFFPKQCVPTPTLSKGCISKKNEFMLVTTCSVHGGSSGGAILDEKGCLIGIIVFNVKLNGTNALFPRINMVIPYAIIAPIIKRYIQEDGKK